MPLLPHRVLAASVTATETKEKQRHKLGVDAQNKGAPAEWHLFLRNGKGGLIKTTRRKF